MEELFITCAEHLEPLLLDELKELRVPGLRLGARGVYAEKSMDTVYTVNYLSRLATRVLWPLTHFFCPDQKALYAHARRIPFLNYMNENQTFAIDSNVSHHPRLRHSLYAAQVVKDALCDVIREAKGSRPSVDLKNPDVQWHLFIHKEHATLSLDTSGAPLYKRGWKKSIIEATLPETIAAALLRLARYTPEEILCDPFCGSGTLLIEAASIATQTPAGFLRKTWGFLRMPEHDEKKWQQFKQIFDAKRIPLGQDRLFGADKDLTALSGCSAHCSKFDFGKSIALTHKEVYSYSPAKNATLIITDPPFGKRLTSSAKIYEELGLFLKKQGARGFILAPDEALLKPVGGKIKARFPLNYGGMESFLFEIDGIDVGNG
jgi:putative N6-adenine-specific DNA methylase